MKTIFVLALVCLMAALAADSKDQAPANLVKNGDFQNGPEGWALPRTKDEKTIKWDEDAGAGRAKCFKAAVTKDLQKLQQNLECSLLDDRLYELSADVKCDADNTDLSLAVVCGYGVTRSFVSGKTFDTGKWARLSVKVMVRNDQEGDKRKQLIIEWSNKTLGDKAANVYLANIQLKEIARLAVDQPGRNQENLLRNGDFENGLDQWANARLGGFEISDKGFTGNCAALKADKEQIRGAAQKVVVANEDALYRLSFKMRPENTDGGKYYIGVMFIFCDLKDCPWGYYYLPLPSKQKNAWLDKTCYFYVEKLAFPAGQGGPAEQMKVKIDFYGNPAKVDTKMVYYFDNINLAKMEKALKP